MCVEQVFPSLKGLFKIFQKAPAPTGAFWFPLFGHFTEIFALFDYSVPLIFHMPHWETHKVREHYHCKSLSATESTDYQAFYY